MHSRYYHHETLGDVRENLRGWAAGASGIDASFREERSAPIASLMTYAAPLDKRPGSPLDSPHSTKECPRRQFEDDMPNREHQRLIMLDIGKGIYKTSSRGAILRGVIGWISGTSAW